jgi:hypothetical protein
LATAAASSSAMIRIGAIQGTRQRGRQKTTAPA